MKRYTGHIGPDGEATFFMDESPTGAWVKFEDHEAALAEAQGERAKDDAYLKALYDATNRILDELVESDVRIEGAINYGDLSCTQAVTCRDNDGHIWHEVRIEEVSPDASKLHQYLWAKLEEQGFPEVSVITEW